MTKNERVLSRWGLLMVGKSGPILAGCEDMEIQRTSTPLVSLDPFRLTAVTASGRTYRLIGEPEPRYALNAFHLLWNAGRAEVRVLTPAEAVAIIKKNGNQPFAFDEEERLRLDLKKISYLSDQFVRQMRLLDLDEAEAARRSGLSLEKLQALLEHDPARVTGDEADAAFVRLVGTAYGWGRPADENEDEPAGPDGRKL